MYVRIYYSYNTVAEAMHIQANIS